MPPTKKIRPSLNREESMSSYRPTCILVTGGAGFIASHIVIQLVKQFPQYKVRLSHALAHARDPRPRFGSLRRIATGASIYAKGGVCGEATACCLGAGRVLRQD